MARTIHLRGERNYEEGIASGTPKPGHLVKLASTGTNAYDDTWAVHGTAGGVGEVAIVQENALLGKTVDDAYTAGDKMLINIYKPGDKANIRIKAGQNVAKGDYLTSAGDGTFVRSAAPGSGVTVAKNYFVATMACNATAAEALCPARVL